MKRHNIMLLALVTLVLLSTVGYANASISSYNWIAPLVKNESDSFYGVSVTGYETGSTATLVVNVYNHFGSVDMNISTVGVKFDWGESYNSTEVNMTNVFPIKPSESHVFTVTFTVPDTTKASNLVTHTYEIYAEDVNATTGPKKLLYSNWPLSRSIFVVFSSTQASAKDLQRDLTKYPWGYTIPYFFYTSKAKELYILANGAKTQGDNAYERGDFSGAVSHYQNALTNIENAWSNETGTISGFETALKDLIDSGQNVLNMVGWGYALFGIGFIFMGIGVLVYLVRKSGTPKVSQQA